eukprot:jgi/Bigna1/89471/estExt_fgenesh1_pg.C_500008
MMNGRHLLSLIMSKNKVTMESEEGAESKKKTNLRTAEMTASIRRRAREGDEGDHLGGDLSLRSQQRGNNYGDGTDEDEDDDDDEDSEEEEDIHDRYGKVLLPGCANTYSLPTEDNGVNNPLEIITKIGTCVRPTDMKYQRLVEIKSVLKGSGSEVIDLSFRPNIVVETSSSGNNNEDDEGKEEDEEEEEEDVRFLASVTKDGSLRIFSLLRDENQLNSSLELFKNNDDNGNTSYTGFDWAPRLQGCGVKREKGRSDDAITDIDDNDNNAPKLVAVSPFSLDIWKRKTRGGEEEGADDAGGEKEGQVEWGCEQLYHCKDVGNEEEAKSTILCATFSGDGSKVVLITSDNQIIVLEAGNGEVIAKLDVQQQQQMYELRNKIVSSPGGSEHALEEGASAASSAPSPLLTICSQLIIFPGLQQLRITSAALCCSSSKSSGSNEEGKRSSSSSSSLPSPEEGVEGFLLITYTADEPQDSPDDNGVLVLHVTGGGGAAGENSLKNKTKAAALGSKRRRSCRQMPQFDYLMPFSCQMKLPIESAFGSYNADNEELALYCVHTKPVIAYHINRSDIYKQRKNMEDDPPISNTTGGENVVSATTGAGGDNGAYNAAADEKKAATVLLTELPAFNNKSVGEEGEENDGMVVVVEEKAADDANMLPQPHATTAAPTAAAAASSPESTGRLVLLDNDDDDEDEEEEKQVEVKKEEEEAQHRIAVDDRAGEQRNGPAENNDDDDDDDGNQPFVVQIETEGKEKEQLEKKEEVNYDDNDDEKKLLSGGKNEEGSTTTTTTTETVARVVGFNDNTVSSPPNGENLAIVERVEEEEDGDNNNDNNNSNNSEAVASDDVLLKDREEHEDDDDNSYEMGHVAAGAVNTEATVQASAATATTITKEEKGKESDDECVDKSMVTEVTPQQQQQQQQKGEEEENVANKHEEEEQHERQRQQQSTLQTAAAAAEIDGKTSKEDEEQGREPYVVLIDDEEDINETKGNIQGDSTGGRSSSSSSSFSSSIDHNTASIVRHIDGMIKERFQEIQNKMATEYARRNRAWEAKTMAVNEAMGRSLLPALSHQITHQIGSSLAQATEELNKKNKETISSSQNGDSAKQMKEQLDVAACLKESVHDTFQQHLIPSIEKSTRMLFGQVDRQLQQKIASQHEHLFKTFKSEVKQLKSLREKLDKRMAHLEIKMANILAVTAAAGGGGGGGGSSSAANRSSATKGGGGGGGGGRRNSSGRVHKKSLSAAEAAAASLASLQRSISEKIAKKEYKEAFVDALRGRHQKALMYLCERINPDQGGLLLNQRFGLSQNIVLSLVSQLGASLGHETSTRLMWLRHAIAGIKDLKSSKHTLGVIKTVRNNLERLKNVSLPSPSSNAPWKHRDRYALVLYELSMLSTR